MHLLPPVCTAGDREKEAENRAAPLGPETPWHAVVILIPVRLGVEQLNPAYMEGIMRCMASPRSLGFMVGARWLSARVGR